MSATRVIPRSNSTNGAMILVFGLFLFSFQDVIIKHFSDHLSVLQVVFYRGLIALMIILTLFIVMRQRIPLLSRRPPLMLARGLLGFCSYTCYYLAVASMPLAEVVSITFTMPLFVTALSAVVLREKVGWHRWSAVVVGFIGVLIILSPEGEFNSLAVAFAFGAAISYACHAIFTRFLGSHDYPLTIAFNTIGIFTLASAALSMAMYFGLLSISSEHPSLAFFSRDWAPVQGFDLLLILTIGVIAAVGFFCLSKAYCLAEASAIAPFEFSYILWAVMVGYIFWNEVPNLTTIIGVMVLGGSSLYIGYRERRVQRKQDARDRIAVGELLPQK